MVERSAAFAAEAMGGAVIAGSADRLWRRCALDSRKVRAGEIFFALPGERVDGHRFAAGAEQKGAAAVVIHQDPPSETGSTETWIRVADTYRGLHDLTRALRREVPRKLVGITGSAGKTTTKELLASMLERRFRTERSPGNLNNLYGFPLALMSISDDCEWMVAEMGMSTPGELRGVSLLGQPDVAVFTNIRPAHLENFPDLRGITEAKAGLLAGLAPGGLVVVNEDDPELRWLVAELCDPSSQIIRYGFERPADVEGHDLRPLDGRPGSRFLLRTGNQEQEIVLPLHGLYNAENCLAAAACAHALGVPLPEIAAAVAGGASSARRGEVHHLAGGVTLVDDCYNSNPDAAVKALASAQVLPAERRLAILGDMLELGPESEAFHRHVGQEAAALGFRVVGVGPRARDLVDASQQQGATATALTDADAAASWAVEALASGEISAGDLVLVKGSRGVGLEVVVEALQRAADSGRGEQG